MRESVSELMQRFRLEPLEDNLFRGLSEANGQSSIFGGLVAGQALLAASMTVPEDRPVHSLHAYFLRPGDIRQPVVYDVDRIRDGKSFTTRRVNAIQHGRPICSLSTSFQVEEEGSRHRTSRRRRIWRATRAPACGWRTAFPSSSAPPFCASGRWSSAR